MCACLCACARPPLYWHQATCYLYGYKSSCPTINGYSGTISITGSSAFTSIDNTIYSYGLSALECLLRKDFVENYNIAFTSESTCVGIVVVDVAVVAAAVIRVMVVVTVVTIFHFCCLRRCGWW
jgi:hypothetical protein